MSIIFKPFRAIEDDDVSNTSRLKSAQNTDRK